ncbi:hypothetical protein C8R43DRAFT_891663 [Mycena crocata]|nr:hypothetical protein C8R43DRAFT_893419 [Mycena crocata]KAJ7138554.1 hypothetical protein C8R43DRAFT_893253 [Mycena crocata]KAJ7143382.1 hypothetical protein C8R43DRAFT_891663 [Mycena crocata]
MLPEEQAYLCPVRALASWIQVSRQEGQPARDISLFTVTTSTDVLTENMVSSEKFLTWLRCLVGEVGRNPTEYGTHSCKRGGAQILDVYLRWGHTKILEWGNWGKNSLEVLKRYLTGITDPHLVAREDFLHPEMQSKVWCGACGRNCPCGSY